MASESDEVRVNCIDSYVTTDITVTGTSLDLHFALYCVVYRLGFVGFSRVGLRTFRVSVRRHNPTSVWGLKLDICCRDEAAVMAKRVRIAITKQSSSWLDNMATQHGHKKEDQRNVGQSL